MGQQYIPARRLQVRLRSGKRRKPVDGELTGFGQPLDRFEAVFASSLPSGTTVTFEFLLNQLPLASGRGTVRRTSPRAGVEGLWDWRIDIAELRGDPDAVSCRLAPLVAPELRAGYLDGLVSARPSDSDLEWSRWIDFHSRAGLLLELLAEINSEMDHQALLLSIMEAARRIMEAEASSLILLDAESGELLVKVPTGPARAEISGIRIPAGRGFAGWVAEHGEPLVVSSPQEDPRFYGEIAGSGFRTRNLICVPLTSGRGEVIGVLQAMNRLGSPHFQDDEIPLFSALAQQAAIALERGRLIQESIRRQVLERELELAKEIQTGFWPRQIPSFPGIQIAGSSSPAAHVGGDYYDVIQLEQGRLGLVVADVSGKGVPAALLMSSLRSALRTQLENHRVAGDAVFRVNNALVGDTPSEKFVTLFFAVLDSRARTLTYVNAGHNPPVLFDRTSGEIQRLEVGGPIVGFRANLPYESAELALREGHRLILFSDGITEAQNESEEMFDDSRLIELIRRHSQLEAQQLMDRILVEVSEFSGSAPQADDMTLLTVTLE